MKSAKFFSCLRPKHQNIMANRHKISAMLITMLWLVGIVAADQFTKWLVLTNFTLHEIRTAIPGFLNWVYFTNTGAAFGLFAGEPSFARQAFFVTVAIATLVILLIFYRYFKAQGRIFVHAIGMIAGGAIGNLIDRLRLGSVVDFIDLHVKGYHWPAFNIADAGITVGAILFIIGSLLYKEQP